MRVLLIGHDVKVVELPHPGDALHIHLNAELTAPQLTDVQTVVFDVRSSEALRVRLPELRRQLDAPDAAVLPYSRQSWVATIRSLPARLQSLLPGLSAAGAIAIPTDDLLRVVPFRDGDDPVQDALIRLFAEHPRSRLHCGDICLEANGASEPLPELTPGMQPRASSAMRDHLSRFVPEELGPLVSVPDAVSLVAGLYLMHDCLELSHSRSQDVQGEGRHSAGDYWHAIMHRREPDYGNSKYWYRRVGTHPIFDELRQCAIQEFASADGGEMDVWSERICGTGEWNPFAWVDFCEEAARDGNGRLNEVARRIQWHEMLLLLMQTVRDAYGTT